MLNRKWLNQGIGVAIGLFLATAFIVPLISDRAVDVSIRRGLFSAAFVLVIYVVIAAVKKEQREE